MVGGVFEDFADVGGAVEDLRVGEAQRAEAGAGMGLIAADVYRLLGGRAVVGEAVGLDNEAKLWPVEVNPVAVQPCLGAWLGQTGGAGDGQEAPLELRLCLC
jgi:hypothetical protein